MNEQATGAAGSMRDHPLVGAVELALRRAGFMIQRRSWSEAGDCTIRFRGRLGAFHNFNLSHELIMEAAAFKDQADIDEYVDDLSAYLRKRSDNWQPAGMQN